MSERVHPADRAAGRSAAAGLAVWTAVGAAFAFMAWTAVAGVLPLALPGRPQADPLTVVISMVADLTARLAALATLGSLAGVIAFLPLGPDHSLGVPGRRLARWAGRSAQVWFAASVLMTFANSAFVNGVPLGYTLSLQTWWTFQRSTPSGLAWLTAAIVALSTALVAYASRRVAPYALALIGGTLAVTFIAVTGNVSVGQDHDWATDAAVAAALALVPLAGGAVGVVLGHVLGREAAASTLAAVRRYQRAVVPLVLVAGAAHALIAWQELAGESPLQVSFGVPTIGFFVCLVLLLASWGWRRAFGLTSPHADPARAASSVVRDVVVLIGYAACLTAANHLPPPRFLVPQTIQINYLGYEMDVPATFERLVGLGRPNLLWVLLSLGSLAAYLWGVIRVRRAGGRWSVSRLLAWLGGWGLTLYLAVSGLWEYSTAVYSWHMLVHMTVNMLVPILCVLGAPLTLLDTAARRRAEGELAGPRELLTALAENRLVHWLLSPPALWLNYVSSLYLVYFTPLFPWLMKYHWAHQLMLLHFMVAGYAFFNLVVGVDRQLWRLPHLVKFALMLSIMPFHAIFAVGIMMARSLIGGDFYSAIAVSWVGDLMADQNIAGQITWFTGEIPMFIAVIALAAQWFRQDRTEAVRSDSLADASGDDPMAAYNQMLAQLAEHDRRADVTARFDERGRSE